MDHMYGIIQDPDLPPIVYPKPRMISHDSSLSHALSFPPPPPPGQNRRSFRSRRGQDGGASASSSSSSQKQPYNPYPYPPQYTNHSKVDWHERWFWKHRDDVWMCDVEGRKLQHVVNRVFESVSMRIRHRQNELRRQWEDERLANPPAPAPGAIEAAVRVEFAEKDGRRGLPLKLLLASRPAIERGMKDPKALCFEGWPRDSEWVRIKWPAYPEHEPVRAVVVTQRRRTKMARKPATRLELVIGLTSLVTQYYAEVSELEPASAFAHLALGPRAGRLSLYALRLIGIEAASDGVFDMILVLDGDDKVDKDPPSGTGADGHAPSSNIHQSISAEGQVFVVERVAEAGPSSIPPAAVTTQEEQAATA